MVHQSAALDSCAGSRRSRAAANHPDDDLPGRVGGVAASAVSILGGEDRTGIDLQFRPTATTTIQGRIAPLPGKRIGKGSEVRLRLPGSPSDLFEHRTWVQPDNTFRFLGVPAGSYVLEVQLQEAVSCDVIMRNSEDVLTQMPLDVPPAGLDDVVVQISSGVTMQGRIRFDGKTPRPNLMDIWLTPIARRRYAVWRVERRWTDHGGRPDRWRLRTSARTGRRASMVRPVDDAGPSRPRHTSGCHRSRRVSGVEVTMTIDRRRSMAESSTRPATSFATPLSSFSLSFAPRGRRRTTTSPGSHARGRSMARIASGTLSPATTSSPPSTNAAWATGRARDFSRQSRSKPRRCALPRANRGP